MPRRLSGAFWHPLVFGASGGGPVYRPRRAAYVIARDADGRLACERGLHGGLYLVGGGIETGETPEEAAVREVREEAAASVTGLRFVGALREWFVQPDGLAAWDQTGYFFSGTLVGLSDTPPPAFVWAPQAEFESDSVYQSAVFAVTRLVHREPREPRGTHGGRRLQPA